MCRYPVLWAFVTFYVPSSASMGLRSNLWTVNSFYVPSSASMRLRFGLWTVNSFYVPSLCSIGLHLVLWTFTLKFPIKIKKPSDITNLKANLFNQHHLALNPNPLQLPTCTHLPNIQLPISPEVLHQHHSYILVFASRHKRRLSSGRRQSALPKCCQIILTLNIRSLILMRQQVHRVAESSHDPSTHILPLWLIRSSYPKSVSSDPQIPHPREPQLILVTIRTDRLTRRFVRQWVIK